MTQSIKPADRLEDTMGAKAIDLVRGMATAIVCTSWFFRGQKLRQHRVHALQMKVEERLEGFGYADPAGAAATICGEVLEEFANTPTKCIVAVCKDAGQTIKAVCRSIKGKHEREILAATVVSDFVSVLGAGGALSKRETNLITRWASRALGIHAENVRCLVSWCSAVATPSE